MSGAKKWLYGMAGAFISGGASAITTSLGVDLADKVGLAVPHLTPGQMLIAAVCAGGYGAACYLKQSPLPPVADSGDKTASTDPIKNQ